MRFLKVLLILIIVSFLILASVVFFAKTYLISKIESVIINKIELATNRNIEIGSISYSLPLGVSLKNVNIYNKNIPDKIDSTFGNLSIKIDPRELFRKKQLVMTVKIVGLRNNKIKSTGTVLIRSNTLKNIRKPMEDFSLDSISILKLNVASPTFEIENISGTIEFGTNSLSADNIAFDYNGMPHKLSFDLADIKNAPVLNASVSGNNIKASAKLTKKDGLIKIERSEIDFLGSHLECDGEISELKDPVLLLYASLSLNTGDLSAVNLNLKNICDKLKPEGKVSTKIYFKGRVSDIKDIEIGIKSSSPKIKIQNYRFDDISFEVRMKDGVLSLPLFTAYPYKGVLNASCEIDLSRKSKPYYVKFKASDIDISYLAQDTALKGKKIYGKIFSEAAIQGNAIDTYSIEGKGYLEIKDGNLGPMPILSPLLGNIYGFMRNAIPGLKSVEINKGGFDFIVANRKISTNNLLLSGDILNIYAQGYIDFDKNLNFEVKNEFKETQKEGGEDWRNSIVEFVAGFGKLISKAYLKGTLEKPKWEFEYFGGFKDAIGGKLQDMFKDIF